MELWPHQIKAVNDFFEAVEAGKNWLCLTIPTGGGKTLTYGTIIKRYVDQMRPVTLYTNKKLLTTQNADAMRELGLDFGMRAAGHATDYDYPFQIASMQTEYSRCIKTKQRELHRSDLVVVEEAHIQQGPSAKEILQAHVDQGSTILGVTATPLDMGDMYQHLIVGGTTSQLRECGALVPVRHFAPDEPDLKALKLKVPEGEDLSENQMKKAIMTPTIFGRAFGWYEKLNPEQKPSLLFAPGVNESLWFADQFTHPEKRAFKEDRAKPAIPAAHIDGDNIWIDGEMIHANDENRAMLAERSKDGSIKVVCNRFVLREGINWPWIEHLILAYVAGSLQTFLQIGGRGMRACPSTGKQWLTIQDHGGAYWRHGSLNVDRHWDLSYTNSIVAGIRADRMRKGIEREPWRCPGCAQVMNGPKCLGCGFAFVRKSRPVVQLDGEIREQVGDIFMPRRIYKANNGKSLWEKMYFRSRTQKGERTFRAAMALFARENYNQWPDENWPFMPIHELDKYRLVSSVPRERLK